EATERYHGVDATGRHCRFAAYARSSAFKRMSEYIRANWNVVLQPEPPEWKVPKDEQIPRTISNPETNPFENPLSMDMKAKRKRHTSYSTPIDNDDDNRSPEEWVVGRFKANSRDIDHGFSGADYFESDEFQARAHENMEAFEWALWLETLT